MTEKKTKGAAKRRPSGPSGKNTKPGILLRASEEDFDCWNVAAKAAGVTLSQWIRGACQRRLEQQTYEAATRGRKR